MKNADIAGKESSSAALTRWPISGDIWPFGAVNGKRMTELPRKITDDPYGAAILIRRLVTEQGAAYWRRYLMAFALMAAVRALNMLSESVLVFELLNGRASDASVLSSVCIC